MNEELLTYDTERKVISVSDLTRNIRFLLEQTFAGVSVEGEISNFKHHTSGHMYFSLKDEGAQIQCVMFRTDTGKIRFNVEEGLKVVCTGRISVYPVRGQYQLYVERMEPKGLGELQLRFEQLKERLRKEGLFEAAHKKEIPYLPGRIAVVTSIDGAALRDILNILNRRFPTIPILICPVQVQGVGAAEAIAEAINDLNREALADVMIIGRGGGSLEDLWAFNEEIVARAIFNSNIPVISAVGHEVDFTIADFVADLRAPTPSAAAELVAPIQDELLARLEESKRLMYRAISLRLRDMRQSLEDLLKSRGLKNPLAIFDIQKQRIEEMAKLLRLSVSGFLKLEKERVYALLGKLEALGPVETLKRGFSVTLSHPEGKIIKSIKSIKIGDRIRTKLADGEFVGEVKEVR